MSVNSKILVGIVFLFCAGGCSSYRAVSYPGVEHEAEATGALEYPVEEQDKVRITEVDGTELTGRVKSRDAETITLEGKKKYRYPSKDDTPPQTVSVHSIKTLELKEPSPGKTTLLILGIIGGTIGALGIAIAASGGMGM